MTREDIQATLYAVFELSRASTPVDATSIGCAIGLSATEAAEALLELEGKGLVDASRARLTMKGLVAAVSGGAGLAGARLDLEAARSRRVRRAVVVESPDEDRSPDPDGVGEGDGADTQTRYF
jgi:hypothetical protein